MNITVLDGYRLYPGDIYWDGFSELGRLTVYDRTAYDRAHDALIVSRAKNAQAILTNKTPLPREVLEQLPELKYIGVLATGYNVVDIAAAHERGILVTNIPAYGTASVAQAAIALLLELCNHVGSHGASVKAGDWSENADWCYWVDPLVELAEKTIGIIGYGRIGRVTGRIAQALGMRVEAYDSCPDQSLESDTMRFVSLNTLWHDSDVIALHCPLLESTEKIINQHSIEKMKDGVLLVNNSRGPLIVEQDLADALNSGKVGGAALDVVSTEPIQPDNPLLNAKNCILTPHISWASKEARQRLMGIAANNLAEFLGGRPRNVVL